MLWQKPKFQSAYLGELVFVSGKWISKAISTRVGDVQVSIEGSEKSPSTEALDAAVELLKDIARIAALAVEHIRTDNVAQDFIAGHGELVVDGLTVEDATGNFAIEFGLSAWSDAMIDVQFNGGIPYEILLAD